MFSSIRWSGKLTKLWIKIKYRMGLHSINIPNACNTNNLRHYYVIEGLYKTNKII